MTTPLAPRATEAVRDLTTLSRADVPYAGGKGANLGELAAAGFPVPPGFVVGAPAYASACTSSGLRDRIRTRLESLDTDDTAALEAAARDVQKMVLEAPVPRWLREAIEDSAADAGRAGSAIIAETIVTTVRRGTAMTPACAFRAAK